VTVCQVQFPSPFVLTGVVTQGRADYAPSQFVKTYKVSYSGDCDSWQFVRNSTGHEIVRQLFFNDQINRSC